ncbi:Putative cyclopropane-fatty-acyl-phospholipid synthase [Fulvivirga imtechensis AK7]|uniref:Putative cyclopropane-fatty-acyl-phospholipid synthase n=1 Tax=Fulvivirga imtechensis AK7 TaxID=1237149 RepID=L8JJQ2_9BACT|nr:class I SAM-dependent methyltransferase [Fulvivirga imtechensis]ELR68478.1 Putative cyclopropane-fatty-acyl-phospholipid synthase [Fulvivirga imtechensis AK7]
MAEQKDLDYTYTTIDEIFRLSIGEMGDFSGAKYDGNFSMSLEAAQQAKHRFMAESLKINGGSRILDMGCGWGPFMHYAIREYRATCVGLTLSRGQAAACRKNGLDVYVRDCRYVKPEDFGMFDAIASVGAFEHFCSVEDWKAGRQEEVYRNFFETVYHLLPKAGRLYLQTMTFGKNMIDYDDIDINAEKGSAEYVCALMVKEFPGSWLPYGLEMVERNAQPYFRLVSQSNGRLDYIETIGQWRKRFRRFHPRKYWLYLSLLPKYATDEEFRHRVAIFRTSPNRICFEREIMDHYRLVFEKV